LLGICDRTFRRYIDRYHDAGLEGLIDRRLNDVSHRKAPVDEVLRLEALYRDHYEGWNVKHFHGRYQAQHGGSRSYSWVKNRLQAAGAGEYSNHKAHHARSRHLLNRWR
jgi:hypothetical protein